MSPKDPNLPVPLITISNEWLGGEPCFTGKRVPVKVLFDYLKAGHTLDEFLSDYPSVTEAHARAVIDLANEAISIPVAAE